ncbi:MAG: hypothetical protein KUG57_05935, partial [Ilumatobacteraceae bacterium]|nr:hypothetical protein [Ilumatobacteraceae bacterium]
MDRERTGRTLGEVASGTSTAALRRSRVWEKVAAGSTAILVGIIWASPVAAEEPAGETPVVVESSTVAPV